MKIWTVDFGRTAPWALILLLAAGCGADMGMDGASPPDDMDAAPGDEQNAVDWNQDWGWDENGNSGAGAAPPDEDFIPEEEDFVVQQVAATDSYVFVPNQSEGSDTVALIDGWDFSVNPIRVGLEPVQVVAAQVEQQGAVGYVLSVGNPTVSIIRADQGVGDQRADVRILSIPWEVNQLVMAPDGRHVLAYIDPELPINDSASAASLQTMALIRLGETPGTDEIFELSVTRRIQEIAFTTDGTQAFVVGEEGINRLSLWDIKSDAFIPALDLQMQTSIFTPQDQEVQFSSEGTTMVMRTSQYSGLGLFALDPEDLKAQDQRMVELPGVPTDLDLVEREDGSLLAVATLREQGKIALFEVADAFEADEEDEFIRYLDTAGAEAGIGRLAPDESVMAVFSTLPSIPTVGLVDLETETIETYGLRNQIRSLEISPDSRTAVVVHRAQPDLPSTGDPEDEFRRGEGLTLWDLETGYRRPIVLQGEPEEILMTTDADGHPFLYVMITSDAPNRQGVMRIDLGTHRTDFVRLHRRPMQLGIVAEQVFCSQDAETGRITFLDVNTTDQRTVSGYELNAGIE